MGLNTLFPYVVFQPVFPIGYEASREMVAKADNVEGIHLRPHDLRRHAANYASHFDDFIEISKIILHHSNLSTTERYLGNQRCRDMKWIDDLYG